MNSTIPATQAIDEARIAYAAGTIDRPTAIDRILNSDLQLTDEGAAELLDHKDSAAERYAHMDGHGGCPNGCDPLVPSNRAERRRAARGR